MLLRVWETRYRQGLKIVENVNEPLSWIKNEEVIKEKKIRSAFINFNYSALSADLKARTFKEVYEIDNSCEIVSKK